MLKTDPVYGWFHNHKYGSEEGLLMYRCLFSPELGSGLRCSSSLQKVLVDFTMPKTKTVPANAPVLWSAKNTRQYSCSIRDIVQPNTYSPHLVCHELSVSHWLKPYIVFNQPWHFYGRKDKDIFPLIFSFLVSPNLKKGVYIYMGDLCYFLTLCLLQWWVKVHVWVSEYEFLEHYKCLEWLRSECSQVLMSLGCLQTDRAVLAASSWQVGNRCERRTCALFDFSGQLIVFRLLILFVVILESLC